GGMPTVHQLLAVPAFTQATFLHYCYLPTIGVCIAALFARAWFSFALNFMSMEHTIEFSESGIVRSPFKGWFSYVLTMNHPYAGPDRIAWNRLKRVGYDQAAHYPLPKKYCFADFAPEHRFFSRLAMFVDGVSKRLGGGDDYLTLEDGS